MKRIRVRSLWRSVGFDTFETAIDAANRHPQQANAQADGEKLNGSRFVGGLGRPDRWRLRFAHDSPGVAAFMLDIWPDAGRVRWEVNEEAAGDSQNSRENEPYVAVWPALTASPTREAQPECEAIVDADVLLSPRHGASFCQLFVNEHGFYVYLRGHLILCFSAVKDIESGDDVLYALEDD